MKYIVGIDKVINAHVTEQKSNQYDDTKGASTIKIS